VLGHNAYGQLGSPTGDAGTGSPVPLTVQGSSNVTAVTAGSYHTCALLSGGIVQCWGLNFDGELGNGTTTSSSTPVAVSSLSGATAITAGYNHTCALLSDGTVQCWGLNAVGQLGSQSVDGGRGSLVPLTVQGLSNVTAMSAGGYHTCALLSGGSVRCWGSNQYGELGNGMAGTPGFPPVAVSGLNSATAIGAGEEHSCAILSSGAAECWGGDGSGQLGDGTMISSSTPVAVR